MMYLLTQSSMLTMDRISMGMLQLKQQMLHL